MRFTWSLLILAAAILAGCATAGNDQMSADKLALLKKDKTTRAEMVKWFGAPVGVGIDRSGMATATWVHIRVSGYSFKQQMLAALFDTNDVLTQFTLTDPIQKTNAPPAAKAVSPKGR